MKRRVTLISLRKARKWLQKDVVDLLLEKYGIKITVSFYGMIEQGARNPNLELASAIANLYDSSVETIFFAEEDNEMLFPTGS